MENNKETEACDTRAEQGTGGLNLSNRRPTILEELRVRRSNLIRVLGKCNQAIERLENNKAVVYEIDNLRKDYLL